MSTPLLDIRSLHTRFLSDSGTVEAVRGISFSMKRGETVGIVGESGSGKSVTALSIMRLISSPGKITNGEILFYPQSTTPVNLLSLTDKEIRSYRGNNLAMIFQEPMTSLNPVLTCGDQVAEALILHKKLSKAEARQRSISLFEKVRLPNAENIFGTYPHQLSGGQKQRVMIAMAMSCDPDILIADEPTTALDVTVQKNILELMRNLQQENGMGLLFISHDLGVIAEIADRVLVMYKGNIVEEGSVQAIFDNPQHPYTKGLLACRPPLDIKLKTLPTINDFMIENSDGSITEIAGSFSDSLTKFVADESAIQSRRKTLYEKAPLLKIENLSTHFPQRDGVFGRVKNYNKAVDQITFDVFPGETLGLVGESGCGKTTLARTILRLIEPTAGRVIFKETDFGLLEGKELRKMRRHIQMIFQDPLSSLNPRMPVGKAIMEPLEVHDLFGNEIGRKRKTIELLQRVGLGEEHFNRLPSEFSGGQRQRICIARALSVEPELIICDECVSALDVSIQAQVLNLLNELKRDLGFTNIFISHDLSVVKYMCDRMLVMKNGKIEEQGDPDQIYANPVSDYTRQLIEAIPVKSYSTLLG